MSTQFDHVSVVKQANVYFGGKCISYNLIFPNHGKKTVGVVLPGTITFSTDSPEIIEVVAGKCRVRIGEDGAWNTFEAGQRFQVRGNSSFDLETQEPLHYVCHFGSE